MFINFLKMIINHWGSSKNHLFLCSPWAVTEVSLVNAVWNDLLVEKTTIGFLSRFWLFVHDCAFLDFSVSWIIKIKLSNKLQNMEPDSAHWSDLKLPPSRTFSTRVTCYWEFVNSAEQFFNLHIQILSRKFKERGGIWEVKFKLKIFHRKNVKLIISNFVFLETLNFLITPLGKVNKDIIKVLKKRGF